MQLSQFLQRVLPHEGIYCATTIDPNADIKKAVSNTFLSTTEDIARFIESRNGQVNLYHACASYKQNGRRTKDNVHKLRSIYADIDIRPDKGYHDFPSAFQALNSFLATSKLPLPTTVFTGSGIHLYWTFKQDLDPETWQKYANGLKSLAALLKFNIDAGITVDSCRILRSPGTLNLKWGKESKILRVAEDYDISQFMSLALQKLKEPVKIDKEKKDFKPVDAAPLFAGCAQMAAFKAGKEITGETWVGVGRLLSQCIDGEKIWHEYSALDERYNEAEAAKKWNESIKFNNAVTCNHFRTVNPDGCKGCPHKFKTPIALSYKEAGAPEEYTVEIREEVESNPVPFGFKFNGEGALVFSSQKKDEENPEEKQVTRYPFIIKDRSTGQLDSKELTVVIHTWRPKDGWNEYKVPIAEIMMNPVVSLSKLGVMIADPNLVKHYVQKSFDNLAGTKHMVKTYDTFGWKEENKFLLGERLYRYEDGKLKFDRVPLGAEAASIAPHLQPGGVKREGSVEGWREAAQGLFAKGHEWQAIALLSGAAAPLLGLQGETEGGTIYSLYDAAGGTGKTTANTAGVTWWGNFTALSTNAADTVNARMAKLGTLCNLPLAYDEMKRDNPGIARTFIQTFTVGSERARMGKDGALNRNPRNWRTVMLTSANTELIGAIAAGDGSEAMSDRVLEVHADRLPLNKGEIDTNLKNKFLGNVGFTGPILLGLIMKDIEGVKIRLAEAEKKYMNIVFNSKLRFRVQLLSAIDVVSRLIADAGLLTFDPQYYIDWLLEQISSEIDTLKHATFAELLSRYMRENVASTLITKHHTPGTPKRIVNDTKSGKVLIRVEEDTGHIVIPRKDLEIWLQEKDRSIRSMVKETQEFGILIEKGAKRNLGAGTQFATGQETVLIFNGKHPAISGAVPESAPVAKVIPLMQDPKPAAFVPRLATLSKLT